MLNRPNIYKVSREQGIEEIKKQSGLEFDPEIVDIFVKVMSGKKI